MTHCQICGRLIQAKTGLIAHHGYKRPHHQGWQTASCFGARWRPYEVACDALPEAIKHAEQFRAQREASHLRLIYEPNNEFDVSRRDAWGKVTRQETARRPAGFDPTRGHPGSYGFPNEASKYTQAFWSVERNIAAELQGVTADIKYLRQRVADWKPFSTQKETTS